jgi:TP901-1 family phage major tail protein
MAIFNGTDLILKVSPSDGGTAAKLMHSQSVTLDVSVDTIDITTKDSSGRQELLTGLSSFSLSSDGLMDFNPTTTSDTEFDELFVQAYTNRTKVTFTFTLASTSTGDYTFSGSGAITALSISGGVEDAPTYSVSIQGSGALTKNDI